jgi:hypothetical protein
MKENERAKARVAFEQVLSEYPSSPFVEPARRFLSLLKDVPRAKPEPAPAVEPAAPVSAPPPGMGLP